MSSIPGLGRRRKNDSSDREVPGAEGRKLEDGRKTRIFERGNE